MPAKKKKKTRKKTSKTTKKPRAPKGSAPIVPERKEKGTDKSKHQAIRELIAQVNADAEHTVIAFACDAPNTYALRRPCGVMDLDIDTGGGLPAGGQSVISGPDNAGKTFLGFKYAAMHQRIYGPAASIAFVQVESAFDFVRARQVGVRVRYPQYMIDQWAYDRQLRGMPYFTEQEDDYLIDQVGEVVVINSGSGEETLNTVLECVRSKLFNIIFVDSIAMLLSETELDKTLSEPEKRAARASLQTKFQIHYTPHTAGLDSINETTLIFVNQVRANNEKATAPSHMQKYIKEWAPTGAWAIRHGKLIDVTVWDGAKIKKTIQGQERTVGKKMKWEITKGKAGTHDNRGGETNFYYEFYLPEGTDDLESVIVAGIQRGVIHENKGVFHVTRGPAGEIVEGLTGIPGYAAFKKMMAADIEFELAVRREVLAAEGIQCLYKPPS